MTLSHSIGRTLAPEAAAKVKDELHGRVYVADTADFLERILPVDDKLLQRIFATLTSEEKNYYNKGEWTALREASKLEKSYYEPFVNVCNSIRDAVGESNAPSAAKMKWLDSHAHTMNSQHKGAAEIRPDCVLATDPNSLGDYEARLKDIEDNIQRMTRQLRSDPGNGTQSKSQPGSSKRSRSGQPKDPQAQSGISDTLKGLKHQRDELIRIHSLWWMKVHVPTEIKAVGTPAKYAEAVAQLFRYIRQIFRDQLDRRFVIGIVLIRTKLTVWISDRSGVIGMQEPIDIHAQPKKFIQVIAALHSLPPNRLGWDTTMKLHDGFQPVPSYTHAFDVTKPAPDIYSFNWVISMPIATGRESAPAQQQDYITVSVLSIAQSELMCGRTTIAFVVIPYEQRRSSDGRTFHVLKQSYRPVMTSRDGNSEGTSMKEADYYEGVDHPNVAKLIACGDVIIDGKVDSTLESMRRGLQWVSDSDILVDRPKMGMDIRPDDEESLAHIVMSDIIPNVMSGPARPPRERIYTRVLLEGVGFGAKLFLNKSELIRTFKNVIEGHKYLYQERQVLQRDCSLSNMLISITNGIDVDTQGSIIDLDHAKKGRKINVQSCKIPDSLSDDTSSDTFDLILLLLYKKGLTREKIDTMYTIMSVNKYAFSSRDGDKDSAKTITDLTLMMISYVGDRQEMLKSQTGTLESLNWEVPATVTSFSQHKPRNDHRTGTLPFMATQILHDHVLGTSDFYNHHPWVPDSVVHDAPHDMESVFWCLLYLCLTRRSSGGVRWDELQGDNPDPYIRKIVYCLFDGDEAFLKDNKLHFINKPKIFKKHILDSIHPSFDDFKPLLEAWWNILILAFKYRAFEYWNIHDMFLKAIEDCFEQKTGPAPEPDEAVQDERPLQNPDQAEQSERQRRERFFEKITTALVEAQESTAPTTPSRNTYQHSALERALTPMNESPISKTFRDEPDRPDSPTPQKRKTR